MREAAQIHRFDFKRHFAHATVTTDKTPPHCNYGRGG